MKKKRLYLMGGIGNILFQIDHGIRNSENGEEIEFVTNFINSKFYSKFFNWTFHQNDLHNYNFNINLNFRNLSLITVLVDLFFLWSNKKRLFKSSVVSWESSVLTKVNFGYFQYPRKIQNRNLLISSSIVTIEYPVLHLRLGDSPSLKEDVESQIRLLKSLKFSKYIVITNDSIQANDLLKNQGIEFEIQSNCQAIDFYILSNCKIIIIPQSTFSWMAAYENTNLEKIYVHQKLWSKLWFNTNVEIVTYN
jgi:hypothetical protein